MRRSHFLILGAVLIMASACAAPQTDVPPQAASAAATVAPSAMPSPPQPAEPTATPSLAPTATATPTPAPGMLPINAETLGQLRSLWSQEFVVEAADESCSLMDCYAPSQVFGSAFSPDGKQIAVGYCEAPRENRSNPRHYRFYCDSTPLILLLDAATGSEIARLETGDIPLSVAFHPERPVAAFGLANRDIELWDLEEMAELRTLSHSSKRTGVERLAFSPDGAWLMSLGDNQLQVWNWEDAPFLQGTVENIWRAAFSPDGQRLATIWLGEQLVRIRVYDLPFTGKFSEVATGGASTVAFSPDGSLLIGVRTDGTSVFDAATGKPIQEYAYDALGPDTSLTQTGLFAADGSLLWHLSEFGAADASEIICGPMLWDPRSGKGMHARLLDETCLAWEENFAFAISQLERTLSPDQRLLLILNDGELQIWGVDPAQPPVDPVCMGACSEG